MIVWPAKTPVSVGPRNSACSPVATPMVAMPTAGPASGFRRHDARQVPRAEVVGAGDFALDAGVLRRRSQVPTGVSVISLLSFRSIRAVDVDRHARGS